MSRIPEGAVGVPPGAILEGIIALEEQRLVGLLSILEIPPMVRVRLHHPRLVSAVWIHPCSGNEVAVGHGTGVCDRERVPEDGLDGTPNLLIIVSVVR